MTAVREPARELELQLQLEAQQHESKAKNLHALLDLPEAMELRQIELIYRAEGNANLVLALPQFKKVLRLPKMISSRRRQEEPKPAPEPEMEPERVQENEGNWRPEGQCNSSAGAGGKKAGDLTMPDFMAYIGIMRRLLGNEFVCGADIVAIPKEDDRFWINEHIRAQRPVSRLDKEFVGPFGLLLPDVTQLPASFDVLLANLQAKDTTGDGSGAAGSKEGNRNKYRSGVRRLGHTYAIEIKPKQGWLQLASDVNDLFDLMPAGAQTKPTGGGKEKEEKLGQIDQEHQALTRDKCWCRYCSMQLLKVSECGESGITKVVLVFYSFQQLHNGKIKRLGHYCPLELFSGAPSRMLDALDALLACPQNNLRVFQNGNLIYGDHANSISFDELHSRVFPGEIMVLIKHLLVACLLREYGPGQEESSSQFENRSREPNTEPQQNPNQSCASIAAMETKAGAVEIGSPNVDRARRWEADSVVNAGQSSTRTRAAAPTASTQRYTKLARMDTTTVAAAAAGDVRTGQLPGNVLEITTRTETETETRPTPSASTSPMQNEEQCQNRTQNEAANQTLDQISKAEIFRLPKNCVLQKILNLQLLVKRHFSFMWHSGYALHSQPTYHSLRGLLCASAEQKELELKPDPEQAYTLGATALDCSIMLTFQELEIECETEPDFPAGQRWALSFPLVVVLIEFQIFCSFAALQPWHVSLLGHHFLTKLCVLDLDPKPDSHFHKFIAQTREIEKCRQALN
ncbi:hypothetical protein KR009_004999 [Drosophila setifemur]|nr:hypothetical protein KR009_004999 [Drosophila setifemur]